MHWQPISFFSALFACYFGIYIFCTALQPFNRLIFFSRVKNEKQKKTYSGKHTREKWHISYKFYIWNNKMMLVFGNLFILVSRSLFHPKDWTRWTETDIMFYLQRQRIDWKCERERERVGKKTPSNWTNIAPHWSDQLDSNEEFPHIPFSHHLTHSHSLSHSQWNVIFHRFNL